ncbi:Aspartate aminotransferase [Lactiplantibacillus plantarum]|nr:Aspartate aminotransferase [Lactiplantibacillus plantarum]
MVNTILKEADLFCPNSVRINFTIYQVNKDSGDVLVRFGRQITRVFGGQGVCNRLCLT